MLTFRPRLVFIAFLLVSPSLCAEVVIDTIEINQAIGVQKDGHRKFVAGKDAVVRAFLAEAVTIDESKTSATIRRDGHLVAIIPPITQQGPARIVDFLCPTRAACGNWAAGRYEFEVKINGATRTTRGTAYDFVERDVMRILAVPVTANYGGTIVPVSDDRWKNFAGYVRSTYPIAADKLIWVTREPFDASDRRFDLETEDGQEALWSALAKLVPEHCAGSPHEDGCYTQVFGFIQARPEVYPNGTLQGFTYGMPANIGVLSDDDAAATVSHEIGHTYGLGDTYDGGSFACDVNPAPDNFRGTNIAPTADDEQEAEIACSAGRVQLTGVSATKIPAEHHPYEVGGRGALADAGEYMGSQGKQFQFWTSRDAYDHLFDALAPKPEHPPAGSPQRYVQCFGTIHRHAASEKDVRIDPCWTFNDRDPIASTTGEYELAAADASGKIIASTSLQPGFDPVPPKGRKAKFLAWGAFEGVVPFPKGVARLQIISGGKVLREIAVGAHAPTVAKVAPEAKGRVKGKLSITWDADDAEHASLAYQVDYNADISNPFSEWEVLRRDLTGKRFTIDFDAIAGGPHAKIRVWASDGVLTASAISAEFRVPVKPPQVTIEALPNNGVYSAGDDIILDGDAFDLQDDDIKESELRWSADGRSLGKGTPLKVAHLKAGDHLIKLSVTNSLGKTGTATVRVRVQPRP
ncbi:MAG: hypothetical protein QOC81_4594 [Thermoanaerobaculia bacterium]|jgi:hypothetical protein|nr:hypothetical protein [Thermoanaerobaculia bacterium]